MRIAIYKGDDRGCVDYNPYTKEVQVHHGNKEVRKRVYSYLTTEQSFRLGGGRGQVGDFEDIIKIPTEHASFIELALCMLYHNTGVHVDWSDPSNLGYEEPVVTKSLNGDVYQIL